MIEELISRVFFTRNAAHMAHWQATGPGSFAKHMALGDFYDGVVEALDDFVESYQGAFGLVGMPSRSARRRATSSPCCPTMRAGSRRTTPCSPTTSRRWATCSMPFSTST